MLHRDEIFENTDFRKEDASRLGSFDKNSIFGEYIYNSSPNYAMKIKDYG